MQSRADVVVIGGGATGTGIARDLAMRGADVTLVERGQLGSGTSGRMHGLLHSGARYAVEDAESARQCIDENRILRDIASHCVEETGGLFVQLTQDSDAYFEEKRASCEAVGIPAEELTGEAAREMEPLLSEHTDRALRVPDAAIDPFRLIAANAASAEEHGATILQHTSVSDILVEDGTVEGVTVDRDGASETIQTNFVVNAAGPWAGEIAHLADIFVPMRPAKGAMVVTNVRQVDTVINRCRPKTEGDILVPHETTALLGTTDRDVDDPDDFVESQDEVDLLVDEIAEMVPAIREARRIRAYWGVRPLYDPASDPESSTDVSRDFTILDHADRDGVDGFTSIVGGKLTTYRLMAEEVADRVATALGIDNPCRTAEEPLPGSRGEVDLATIMDRFGLRSPVAKRSADRLGDRTESVLDTDRPNPVLCECEGVTRAEVRDAIDPDEPDIHAVRMQTRASMGTCQGAMCATSLAAELAAASSPDAGIDALQTLLEERWRGQRRVAGGYQLDQMALTYWLHGGQQAQSNIDFDAFNSGDADGS